MKIGTKLRLLRAEKGWTKSSAARSAKIPISSYRNYEKESLNRKLPGKSALALANAFGVSLEYLLDDARDYPPRPRDRRFQVAQETEASDDGEKTAVITTDTARAGGVEQLSAFMKILSLPLLQAEDARELKAVLAKNKNVAQIIIDTGGLNPFDPQEMKLLAQLINVEDMDPALVLPAGIDAEESAEIAMTFSILGVKRLIPTRLDFSRHLGGILSAADRAGLSFTEGSHTPQVAGGILRLTPDTLAGLLMPNSPKKK